MALTRKLIMMTMIKKNFFYKTAILSGLLMVFSCSQDPIFYKVSTETVPIPPLIPGAPTNMVVFNREYPDPDDGTRTISVPIMYVASGSVHWYTKTERGTGEWDMDEYFIPHPKPGDKVIDLAATDKHLYALSISASGVTTTLRRIGTAANDTWEDILIDESDGNQYKSIQSIYADKDRLFAGAINNNNGNDFGLLYLDDTTLKLLEGDTGMLSGAARLGAFHYLCTRGKGVFKVALDMSSVEQLMEFQLKQDEEGNSSYELAERNCLFMGMIQLDNTDRSIIVIERNRGTLFEVQETGFRQIRYQDNGEAVATGKYATGALAFWQEILRDENEDPLPLQPGYRKMLIAGIQGGLFSSTTTSSSYTHGYMEFDLDNDLDKLKGSDGWLVFISHNNISPDITVDTHTDRYSATIGKHPINHMYQVQNEIDNQMIFFASTQTAGLWSYRNRDDGLQWNAENRIE
jgi:hypothetical protein